MPASGSLPDLDGSPLSEADRRALTRFLEQSLDHGFRLVIIEASHHADREAILTEVALTVGPRLLRLTIDELHGADTNLWRALQEPFTTHAPRCLALWGFESASQSDWARQLNVQRDLFVTDFAVPWLLFIHPTSRVPLLQAAPDFCDFAVLWLRDDRTSSAPVASTVMHTDDSLLASGTPSTANPLLQQARAALDTARFDAARDALSQFDLQPDHDVVDRVSRQLYGARLEREQGHLALAEALARDAQSILARQPPSANAQALMRVTIAELGICLLQSGRYEEAETLLRTTLPLVAQALGREHPDYSTFLGNLGDVLTRQGKYTEAECVLREPLAIQATLGRVHPSYGPILNNLAAVLLAQGKFEEAECIVRESLQVKATTLGPEHPSYAASLHNLASVLSAQGKYHESKRVLDEVLALKEKVLGIEHPDYLRSLNNLATILLGQGKFMAAERILRASLPGLERAVGREHPDYSGSLHNLATILSEQGKYSEAERLIRESLALREKTLGRDFPGHGESLHQLADSLTNQGKYGEAERIGRESLSVLEKALGPDHPRLCPVLANLAVAVAHQGRTREGIRLLQRALHIGQTTLGAQHPTVQHMRNLLKQLQRLPR